MRFLFNRDISVQITVDLTVVSFLGFKFKEIHCIVQDKSAKRGGLQNNLIFFLKLSKELAF